MKTLLALVVIIIIGVVGYRFMNQDTVSLQSDTAPVEKKETSSDVPPLTNEEPVPVPQSEEIPSKGEVPATDVGMELPPIIDHGGVVFTPAPSARVFTVAGTSYAYDVQEIRVKKGDTVTVNFTSTSGFHDWVVDEFSARTEKVGTGKSSSVTFVADKVGTFEYYCSVGSHRKMGMVGKLIVE